MNDHHTQKSPASRRLPLQFFAAAALFFATTGALAQQLPKPPSDETQVVVFVLDGEPAAVESMKQSLRRATKRLPSMNVHFFAGKWEVYAHWVVSISMAPAADPTNFFYAAAFTKPETAWNPVSPAMLKLKNQPCIPPPALTTAMDASMLAVSDFKSMYLGSGASDAAGFDSAAREIARTLYSYYVQPAVTKARRSSSSQVPPGLQNQIP